MICKGRACAEFSKTHDSAAGERKGICPEPCVHAEAGVEPILQTGAARDAQLRSRRNIDDDPLRAEPVRRGVQPDRYGKGFGKALVSGIFDRQVAA